MGSGQRLRRLENGNDGGADSRQWGQAALPHFGARGSGYGEKMESLL